MTQYAFFSIKGNIRSNHEDNLYVDQCILPLDNAGIENVISGELSSNECQMFAVFDGMGGESCGEVAAYIAADTIRSLSADRFLPNYNLKPEDDALTDPDRYLDALCHEMNRRVCRYAKEHRIRSMGTTMACILFMDQKAFFASIGDSRIYLIHERSVTQITTDHTFNSIFYAKPPLTQYLGIDEDETALLPGIGSIPINIDDRYMICTDGVTDMLSEDDISNIIQGEQPLEKCMSELKHRILQAGARDNSTAILCGFL